MLLLLKVRPVTGLYKLRLPVSEPLVSRITLKPKEARPPLTAILPEPVHFAAVGGGGAFTVNVKVVVWDREPAKTVTVIVDDPVGVEVKVVTVNVDEQVGLHDPGENEAVAPVGRPEAENVTA